MNLTDTTAKTSPDTEELHPVYLLADTDPEAMKQMNSQLTAAFRASGGRLDGDFAGVPLLLLTTTGRRSGAPRTIPVLYTRHGSAYVVIASKSGAATDPDWYRNLCADPRATIEVGGRRWTVTARIVEGAQGQRLFDQHAAQLPNHAAYQRRTTRRLPVVILEPDTSV